MNQTTKLYLLEWDKWSLEGLFKTKSKAQYHIGSSYMETIKEIELHGDIINNEVFIIMDSTNDYKGIHCTREDAQTELDGYYAKGEFKVELVKLLG